MSEEHARKLNPDYFFVMPYGFIKEDDSDTEHFVHVSGLIDRITEGDKVEFELKEGNKGLNAINVKVIS